MTVGFDDDGRLLAFDFSIWHDNGAYLPYGIIVLLNTSTQVLGPYKPRAFRVDGYSLYTNTVIVTPYRGGAGRPQGVFAMERSMDAIAKYLGKDVIEVRETNLIRPEEMPYDFHLIFQDGRPPLIYDTGDYQTGIDKVKASSAGTSSPSTSNARRPRGDASASASEPTSRAPDRGRTRAHTCSSKPPARSRPRRD